MPADHRNFASSLFDAEARGAGRPAVRDGETLLTYGRLADQARRVAGALHALGVRPGDRVAIRLPTSVYFPPAFYGALQTGAVIVPINPLLKAREIEHQLRDAGVKVLISGEDPDGDADSAARQAGTRLVMLTEATAADLLERPEPRAEVVAREPQDPAVIMFTSGTTGRPKGAVLVQAGLAHSAEAYSAALDITADSVLLATLPLFHIYGLNTVMNTAILAAGQITLIERFTAEKALAVIQRDRVTHFSGVPTMFISMLHAPDRASFDVSSLKLMVAGGAATPVEVLLAVEEAFGCAVIEGYGLSETTGLATLNPSGDARRPGSVGRPNGDTELRVVTDDDREAEVGAKGELVIRSSAVMTGYWGREEETAEAMRGGWFHTGDVGYVDADGYFYVVDRKKDLIIRAGFNVYPREIEELLYEHPAIRDAAVIGIPHESLGEEIGAAVVLRPGAEATADEIRQYVKDQVAPYKYPRVVWFVAELPKGATGKIQKREIQVPGADDDDLVGAPKDAGRP